MRKLVVFAAIILSACAETQYQAYQGNPKPENDVAIVRLWTPTTSNVFSSPGLLVKEIDGKPAGDVGRAAYAYLLPGEHEVLVAFIQVKGYNLLCGALCDAIFNKPRAFKASVEPGKIYLLKYINDDKGTVVLEDKGAAYPRNCLLAREWKKESC